MNVGSLRSALRNKQDNSVVAAVTASFNTHLGKITGYYFDPIDGLILIHSDTLDKTIPAMTYKQLGVVIEHFLPEVIVRVKIGAAVIVPIVGILPVYHYDWNRENHIEVYLGKADKVARLNWFPGSGMSVTLPVMLNPELLVDLDRTAREDPQDELRAYVLQICTDIREQISEVVDGPDIFTAFANR